MGLQLDSPCGVVRVDKWADRSAWEEGFEGVSERTNGLEDSMTVMWERMPIWK